MQQIQPYIYQKSDWPHFVWDAHILVNALSDVSKLQGNVLGAMESLGFEFSTTTALEHAVTDIIKSAEIEGEIFDPNEVRSSLARNLGLDIAGLVPSDRHVEGMVSLTLDATQRCHEPMTKERLCDWHAALFPTGRSGMYRIVVGDWRDDSTGPMQVVSGALGKEKVHFQAPEAAIVSKEMDRFLIWLNTENELNPILKAGIAHFWFVTVHPFEDGNGRIARALTDMLLARADGVSQRFYSMSAQIRIQRKQYYNILEKSQQGSVNITPWLSWFLACLEQALLTSKNQLAHTLQKHHFWNQHRHTVFNERQQRVLERLWNGFEGKLTTSKWAKLCKCSTDTALRDIQGLVAKNILIKETAGGRSTHYTLNIE